MEAHVPMIKVSDVVQQFGRKTPFGDHRQVVLDKVNLEVEQGTILCLLGPSGCGKTTLVNLLMGITIPYSGSVQIMGESAPYPTTRKRIGFMPQDEALYNDITGEDNLRFFGTLYGLKGEALSARIDRVLAFVRLSNDRKKLVSHYSGGMQRRLSLAVAMLHNPDLLILDEPTVGLDPEHRIHIWGGFRDLAAQGTTILVTTHIMDEAERCDEIAMLRGGHVIAKGAPKALKTRTGADNLEDAFLTLGIAAEQADPLTLQRNVGEGIDGTPENEGEPKNAAGIDSDHVRTKATDVPSEEDERGNHA